MYNGIEKIEAIIEEIEEKITEAIDYEALAAHMTLSVYEFRRIFAFIVGCPLSEYIRKRRLSLAACELMNSRASIQSVSEKYGYSTLAAFSKAFSEYHGIAPSVCSRGGCEAKLFPRPKFELHMQGGTEQSFHILSDTAFAVRGYRAISDHTDALCCEQVWNDFYAKERDKEISGEQIYAVYRNENGLVQCTLGERTEKNTGTKETVPCSRWLSVKMNTTEDSAVNRKYNEILCEILPSAKLKRHKTLPTVEVFPRDMETENFEWEIRIPIEGDNNI